MKNIVILENIRSAYNVGNIIRTADALGRDVWLTGYTPSPVDSDRVVKTSLGAEESVGIQQFPHTQAAISTLRTQGYSVVAAELADGAMSLSDYRLDTDYIAVVFGNEVVGVEPTTLQLVEHVLYVPMHGIKESLNVGQTAAIFMRELK